MTAEKQYMRVSRPRQLLIVSLVALGIVAGAGVASAVDGDPADEVSEETLLNFGYDAGNHILLVNTSATDSIYDYTLENGTLAAQYGAADGGRIPVDVLLEEDKAVLFENRPEMDVGSDFTPAAEPVPYAGAGEACGISGGSSMVPTARSTTASS